MERLACAFCRTPLQRTFVDLGMGPLVSAYLRQGDLRSMEPFHPLRVFVCEECFLVQLPESESPETLFGEYPYFSSYSKSWLAHVSDYVEQVVERFGLDARSQVVEVASNDGYLLKFFKERGIPVQGVEPARNIAEVAREAGIPTLCEFFGRRAAEMLVAEGKRADLLVGKNVLAHVPDLNDFIAGMKLVLDPRGIVTMEFPHLLRLVEENQFDTIFHEHFSYLSLLAVERMFAHHGLTVFDVQEQPTHGGSLRVFARNADDDSHETTPRVDEMRRTERAAGFDRPEGYQAFSDRVHATKHKLLEFLIQARREGKRIVGYGAPGKGCILLNYCGIRRDFLDYTVDISPHKQGRYMPGVRIPIHAPDKIRETRPDFVLILPWNLKDEIMEQMAYIREWGGRFVVPIPEVRVYP